MDKEAINEIEEDISIRKVIENITDMLVAMKKEERLLQLWQRIVALGDVK